MSIPRLAQLDREPTDAAPGTLSARGLTLEWDLDQLTIVESGARRVMGFAEVSLQLSQAHLPPATHGWRRWLGLQPAPVPHLVIELRPTHGPRLTLAAPATHDHLAGLPTLQTDGPRVPLGPLVTLVQTARAGGARLARLPANVDPETTGDEIVEQRWASAGYWLRIAVAMAFVVASLPLTLPWALAELDQWGDQRLVEGYAPLVAAIVPSPALALLWWRHGRQWLYRAGPRQVAAWATAIALAPLLFFTVVMIGIVSLDGTLSPASRIDWLDVARPDRLEACLGLWMFHLSSLALARHVGDRQRLRITPDLVSTRQGLTWHHALRSDHTALADLLLSPRTRWLQDAPHMATLLETGPPDEPAHALPPSSLPRELLAQLRPGPAGTWHVPRRRAGIGVAIAVACIMAAGIVFGLVDTGADTRGLVVVGALATSAVWAFPARSTCLIDPRAGVVARRHEPFAVSTRHDLWQSHARSWLDGCSATHFQGVRVHHTAMSATLRLEPHPDAPPRAHRLAGLPLYDLQDRAHAVVLARLINESMAEHGWQALPARGADNRGALQGH